MYLSIDPKNLAAPTLTPLTLKPVCRPHYHILRSRVEDALQSRFACSDSRGTRL